MNLCIFLTTLKFNFDVTIGLLCWLVLLGQGNICWLEQQINEYLKVAAERTLIHFTSFI